jgi:uncharacterized protein YjdB
MNTANNITGLATVAGWVLCLFIGLLGLAIIVLIAKNKIDLSQLISEPDGSASMSRFQLLVFSFVVALSFFLVVAAHSEKLPDVPPTVLSLIGISASSYLVSKGISSSVAVRSLTISPTTATLSAGQSQQFKANVSIDTNNAVVWSIQAGNGTIDQTGLYTAPAAAAAVLGAAPPARQYATIKATSVVDPSLTDLAIVTLT